VEENVAEELVQLLHFEEEGWCEEVSDNEDVEENVAEEVIQLVDFEEDG
jgi:hypothetical protein